MSSVNRELNFGLDETKRYENVDSAQRIAKHDRELQNVLLRGRITWERKPFGTRLAEAGCDAFTIAQLLGHSDVRVTMRYVRSVEETKRVAVEAIKLSSEKVSTNWPQMKYGRRCRQP